MFRYTSANNEPLDRVHCAQQWAAVLDAFLAVGFTEALTSAIARMLAAILHMGNINFLLSDPATISDSAQARTASALLMVRPPQMRANRFARSLCSDS
jgi:myosin heavy subunit